MQVYIIVHTHSYLEYHIIYYVISGSGSHIMMCAGHIMLYELYMYSSFLLVFAMAFSITFGAVCTA